ncbi:acyl-CoA thioesterase [Paenibacillus sp. SYP-B3998]|uniref:Acyl-CoA thioesterase n=1 Tax=Paenibacillus sp. SYP-B3998 TaxID=2678564 RepID=A0A6G4A047_9BACL|nr:thioesterase family protein [Paenibacillus sp. SYP-B3998]NEW07762.1 acyl-CoA thioesterase [Paenibacillus sp. SYP-B3998]
MSKQSWFQHQLRVRFEETDQMGVVYHANYLTWFEIGRTEFIRELGFSYRSIEENGLLLPVVEAEAKFRRPARYDDLICVYTRVTNASSVRIDFTYEVRRVTEDHLVTSSASFQKETDLEPKGELLVTGTTRHVWVNPSWKPARIDKEAPQLWQLLKQES